MEKTKVFNYFSKKTQRTFKFNDYLESNSRNNRDDYEHALVILASEELIQIESIQGIGERIHKTPLFYKAQIKGGLEKWIEHQNKIESKKEKKLNFDFTISEFQAKFKYLPLILSIIAILMSILTAIF